MPLSKEKSFRRRIRVRMVEKDLTVTELAERLGVRRETLSRAIHGHRGSQKLLAAIRKELA